MSSRMLLPSSGAMHLWKTPDMLRLYNSPLMIVYAFERRTICRASVLSSGSSPRNMYERNGCVQVGSTSITCSGVGSSAVAGASESVVAASGGVAGLSEQTGFLALIDHWSTASRNTPGGMGARVDPMLASLSASSLLARPT